MKIYYRCLLVTSLLFIHFQAIGQLSNTRITGITTRILPDAVKSMADIVENDRSHTYPADYKSILRPDPDGPQPVQNPLAQVNRITTSAQKFDREKRASLLESLHSNFLAIWGSYHNGIPGRESAYTPPDNCGDVGTSQVIATANTRLKVFDKPRVTGPGASTPNGNSTETLPATFNVDLNSFFSNSSRGVHNISDTHVRFDRLTKRWFVVAIEVDHAVDNYCCIAVSNSDVITASTNFQFYYFNVSGTGGKANEFFDYPTLGVDKFSLNIGGNMFTNGATFAGCNMWVINKDSIISGVLKVTSFNHTVTNSDIYTPQGVQNDDPNALNGYFVGTSASVYSKLVIRRIDHTLTIPVLLADFSLNTLQTYGPKVLKIPEGDSIEANDHRLSAAMMMKNKTTGKISLWTAQGSVSNASGIATASGDRDGIVWYEIGNLDTTPEILQSSRLYDEGTASTSVINYIYPTIATNGQGHSLLGFSSAGLTKYPQASISGRYNTDTPGTLQPVVDLTAASSKYDPGAPRWGDFTQTVVDPLDNMTMWTFTQYADTINSWGVRAAQIIAPPPPPSIKLDTIPVCNTSTITITGIAINNAAFFDPGNDTNGPGFNRLAITVTGPSAISVSNIKFMNSDTVSASFNLPDGTLSGTYIVTVVNPDGQSSSTSFILANTCSVVKVEIVDFTVKKVAEGTQLNWTTMNEQNIKNFVLEKSGDSINFENFASVLAKGTVSGNSNYSFLDHNPFPNFSYYRLKIYNDAGNFLYSRIIKVASDQKNIALIRLYPNPVSKSVTLDLFSTKDATMNMVVFDFSGRKVFNQSFDLVPGLNKTIINLSILSKAGYIIQIYDNNNNLVDKTRILKQ